MPDLERTDHESEACFVGLTECIAAEVGARAAAGDDVRTPEGRAKLAELIADAILDRFVVRERHAPRYRWSAT
jgi:hypothetical protein